MYKKTILALAVSLAATSAFALPNGETTPAAPAKVWLHVTNGVDYYADMKNSPTITVSLFTTASAATACYSFTVGRGPNGQAGFNNANFWGTAGKCPTLDHVVVKASGTDFTTPVTSKPIPYHTGDYIDVIDVSAATQPTTSKGVVTPGTMSIFTQDQVS